jgi:hypothetical protein
MYRRDGGLLVFFNLGGKRAPRCLVIDLKIPPPALMDGEDTLITFMRNGLLNCL